MFEKRSFSERLSFHHHINYKANSPMSFLLTIARHRTVKAVERLAEFIFCSFLSVGEVR